MFVVSRLLSAFTQPMFWLVLWWALALVLLGLTDRLRRAALRMLWVSLAVPCLTGFRAIPGALLRPLENRYPVPTAQEVSRHVSLIVLGGATQHPGVFLAHGQVPLG